MVIGMYTYGNSGRPIEGGSPYQQPGPWESAITHMDKFMLGMMSH